MFMDSSKQLTVLCQPSTVPIARACSAVMVTLLLFGDSKEKRKQYGAPEGFQAVR